MIKAKDIDNVEWISEFGGSFVLTQAMQYLADQGVKLSKHTIFMNRPTSSPTIVLKLAYELDLNIERKFIKAGPLDVIGNMASFNMAYTRLKNNKGKNKYNAGQALVDTSIAGVAVAGGLGLLGTGSLQVLALASPATAAGLGAMTMMSKAMVAAAASTAAVGGGVATAATIASGVAPRKTAAFMKKII